MSQLPDLVLDSRLRTELRDSIIIHSYLEIDSVGGRFSRKEHWKSERFLGRGGFGQVQLQRCVTEGGAKQNSLRAVKIISKPSNPSGSLDCKRELEAIAKFSHDRYKRWFVKSFGWFENPTSVFITMEYCRHGDLHHYLISQGAVAVEDVQQLTYQILEALDQMHQNDFAHRDLKPGNILIKSMPPEEWWIVLADFGISKRVGENSGPTTAIKGTTTFMAPELLGYQDQVRPKSIADFKAADMWALGEIIFQMLTSETTFENTMELMKYYLGLRGFPSNRLPTSIGDDGHKFVTSLMMALPQDRITTTQCIQHRWLKSLCVVEEELAALNLEQSNPLVPEISWNELASAQWSRLSDPEHTHTETAAQRRPTTPTHLGSSGIRQTQLESISRSPRTQRHINIDLEPLTVARMLNSHRDSVYSVAFSHNSTQLASGSKDNTVKIWDISSGACLQTLKGHSSSVNSVAFLHNSTWLASGSSDKSIKIWDTSSGACVQTLKGHSVWGKGKGHSDRVYSVAFSHNSTQLASGSGDRIVKIWDTSSGACLQTLKGHSFAVLSVAFSHDSIRLASGSSDKTVKIWDASSGACLQTLKGHSGSVHSVAFSHNSTQLASGSDDWTVKIWDASSGVCLQTLDRHYNTVTSVAFSYNSTWLASGSTDGRVNIWDASSGACLQTIRGVDTWAYSIAFSHDSTQLALGSSAWRVEIWSASSIS